MPKISIITTLFNGAKLFSETAESVIAQDYKDWEWILFDDGSSDGTQDIAKAIAAEHKDKIFYFEHQDNRNFGTAFTRNRAIERSCGDVISFIDQDDIWYINRLSYHLDIFDSLKDCAMIWSPALYWYKERSFKQPVGEKGSGLKSGIYEPRQLVENFLRDLRCTPLPSASMVRRKQFNEVKGFEESVKGSEDIVLWIKLASKYSICYDDEIIVKYRKHFDSTLRQAALSGKMYEWNLVFYRWVIEFLKKNNFDNSLTEEYEFSYYTCLKRMAGKKNFFESRRELKEGLNKYPELKNRFMKDFLLDLVMPFDIATKVSAKLRFDWLKKS